MNFVVKAILFQILVTIMFFALIVLLTYLAFKYRINILKFDGKKNFMIVGKTMGLILGVFGANMLI